MNKVTDSDLTKLYYTIGEVSTMFNVNTSLIRFWEKEFDIIQPKKNKKGNRLFTPKDIQNFNKIYHLVKIQGFTLDGAKKTLRKNEPVDISETSIHHPVIDQLEAIRDKLLLLKEKK